MSPLEALVLALLVTAVPTVLLWDPRRTRRALRSAFYTGAHHAHRPDAVFVCEVAARLRREAREAASTGSATIRIVPDVESFRADIRRTLDGLRSHQEVYA